MGRILKPYWSVPLTVILSVKSAYEECHLRTMETD